MSSSPNRAPLLLLLTVALGLGTRFVRERADGQPPEPGAMAALDSQLTRVQAVGKRPSSRGSSTKRARTGADTSRTKRRATARALEGGGSGARGVRSERTPFGALPVEVLAARHRDSLRAAHSPAAGTARRAGSRAPAARGPAPSGTAPEPSRSSPVDVETASIDELERLPRIGPALARRIVEDREANGPFGSLGGLQRVRGIGPAMANLLRGRVTFKDAGRP